MGFKYDPLKGQLVYVNSSGGGGGGAVDSVNSRTGAVVLTSSDVGLGNANNTSDANKPISTATQAALDLLSARITALENNATASVIAFNLKNNTGSTLPILSPVFINNFGNLEPIDIATIPNNVSICILPSDILDQDYGSVVFKGRILDITTSLNIGDVVYLDKMGTFSSNVPVVGISGVLEGDAYIKIGVISENQLNPSNKDLIVDAFIITRL